MSFLEGLGLRGRAAAPSRSGTWRSPGNARPRGDVTCPRAAPRDSVTIALRGCAGTSPVRAPSLGSLRLGAREAAPLRELILFKKLKPPQKEQIYCAESRQEAILTELVPFVTAPPAASPSAPTARPGSGKGPRGRDVWVICWRIFIDGSKQFMCFSEIYRSLKKNEHAMSSKCDIIGEISHFPQRILVTIRSDIQTNSRNFHRH